jgi:hypothetical protein
MRRIGWTAAVVGGSSDRGVACAASVAPGLVGAP